MFSIVKEEIGRRRPVFIGIMDAADPTYNHAVVCDGYQADDYLHLNFGSGGQSDAYYRNLADCLKLTIPSPSGRVGEEASSNAACCLRQQPLLLKATRPLA